MEKIKLIRDVGQIYYYRDDQTFKFEQTDIINPDGGINPKAFPILWVSYYVTEPKKNTETDKEEVWVSTEFESVELDLFPSLTIKGAILANMPYISHRLTGVRLYAQPDKPALFIIRMPGVFMDPSKDPMEFVKQDADDFARFCLEIMPTKKD